MKTWIVSLAALLTGFIGGYWTHAATFQPPEDVYEIKSTGYNNYRTLKINKKTGETWAMDKNAWVRVH